MAFLLVRGGREGGGGEMRGCGGGEGRSVCVHDGRMCVVVVMGGGGRSDV